MSTSVCILYLCIIKVETLDEKLDQHVATDHGEQLAAATCHKDKSLSV